MSKPHIDIRRESSSWNGWCVNYTGLFDRMKPVTHCKAGVEYDSVAKDVEYTYSRDGGHKYSSNKARPCFRHEHPLTDGCSKCRFPTAEEIKAHDEEATATTRDEYDDDESPKNYVSGAGAIVCPVCKTGNLRYSRASINGHVHAACSTENCVSWME